MPEQNDGTNALDQGRMSADPMRGKRSDVVSTTIEGEGHLTAAPTGGTGATRVSFEEMPSGMAEALQANEGFYEELGAYNAERKPETSSWKETEDDEVPTDTSTTADRPSSDD
jgi:hypothetical protein